MVISLRRAKQCKGTDLYEGTDPYGKNLLAIQVATEHHRTALSTVSKAARGVVAQRIASGDVKTMLKQAMIIAHPFASQMITENAERSSRTPTQRIQFTPNRTMDYYRNAFLKLVRYYFREQKIILRYQEYKELVQWVRNDGYLDSSSSEYKEILEARISVVRRKAGKATVGYLAALLTVDRAVLWCSVATWMARRFFPYGSVPSYSQMCHYSHLLQRLKGLERMKP
ncbi:hypothetical protein CRUP_017295 [Coryphaenoides rupestris]|nr:hypothetical protein CRUP_017295 [Coryphaenoides rupestris]